MVANPHLIVIADYCPKLVFLGQAEDLGRPVAEFQFEEQCDFACISIWHATVEHIDEDMIPEESHEFIESCSEADAEVYALKRGYSLRRPGGFNVLPYWNDFLRMIIAEEYDAIAVTPEHRSRLKLAQDADRFMENRKAGVISGIV